MSIVYRRAPYDPLQDWRAYGARVWLLAWDRGRERVADSVRFLHRTGHAKVAVWGVLVIIALVTTLHAATRATAPLRPAQPPLAQRLDDALADSVAAAPKGDMRVIQITKQADIEARAVKTERIVFTPPETVPAPPPPRIVSPPVEELAPPPPQRRQRVAQVERNICTRHNMRKVVTRGGKSWRCMR